MSLYDLILDKVKPWLPIRCWNCVVDNVFQIRSNLPSPFASGYVLTLMDASGTAQWQPGGSGGGSVTVVNAGTGISVINGTTTPTVATTGNFGSQNLLTSGTLTVNGAVSTIGGILQATSTLLATGSIRLNPSSVIPADNAYLRSSGGTGTAVWDTTSVPAQFVTNLTRSNVALTVGGAPYNIGSGVMTVGFTGDCTGVSLTNAALYAVASAASTAGHTGRFTSLTVNNSLAAPKAPAAGDYLQAANNSGDCKWVTVTPGTVTTVSGGTGIDVVNGTTAPVVSFSGGNLGSVGFTTAGTILVLDAGNIRLQRAGVEAAGDFLTAFDQFGTMQWSHPGDVLVSSLAPFLGDTSITLSGARGDVSIEASGAFGSRPISTSGSLTCGSVSTGGGAADLGGGTLANVATATVNPGGGFSTGLILPNGAANTLVLTCTDGSGHTQWLAPAAAGVSSLSALDASVTLAPAGPFATGDVSLRASGNFLSRDISTTGGLTVGSTSTLGTLNVTSLVNSGGTSLAGDLTTSGGITMVNAAKNLTVAGAGSVALGFVCGGLDVGPGGPSSDVFSYHASGGGVGLVVGGGPLLASYAVGGPSRMWQANTLTTGGLPPILDMTLTPAQICCSIFRLIYDGPSHPTDPPALPTWTLPTYNQVCAYLNGTLGITLSTGLTWEWRCIAPSRDQVGLYNQLAVITVREDPVDAQRNLCTEGLRYMRSQLGVTAFALGRSSYAWLSDQTTPTGTNFGVSKSFTFTFSNYTSNTSGLIEVLA